MSPGGFRQSQSVKRGDSDEDTLEKLMKDTGCLELHYEVQVIISRMIFCIPIGSYWTFHALFWRLGGFGKCPG